MTYRIEWFADAVDDLVRLSSREIAERIDRALQEYARSGVGFVRRVDSPEGTEWRLYTRGSYAVFAVDHVNHVIHVWRVFLSP